MLNRQQKVVLPHLCRWIGPPVGGDLSDRDLLERFLGQGDAAAFAALVRRHGPTVLGVCRRIMNDAHDAEDAFQATFLVLVRKARSIVKREALGSWLYGVAYRVALKARAEAARRRKHERQAAGRAAAYLAPDGADLRLIIDEEVNRLPDKYRQPIVLCYFEGKTYQEAARLLGWPAGTASVRLARARALLRSRLAVRGLTPAGAALAAGLADGPASAAEVSRLAEATAGVALRFLTDPVAAGVSTQVIALTEGVVKAMLVRKLKTLAGFVLALGLTCGGAGALWQRLATAPAHAADPSKPTPDAGSGPRPGELLAAGDPAAEPPTASPPRALAAPAADGARPLQTRIGLINWTRVQKGSKKFQALQADMRTQTGQVQQKLDMLKTQLQKFQADRDDPATPADRRDRSADQVRRLQREMEDVQESAKASLTRNSLDALRTMYREVEDMANRIAKLRDLELVLFYTDAVTEADLYNPDMLQRRLAQPGALMPMIAAPGMDITENVIDGLNRSYIPAEGPGRG